MAVWITARRRVASKPESGHRAASPVPYEEPVVVHNWNMSLHSPVCWPVSCCPLRHKQPRTQMKRSLIVLAGCGAWIMASVLMSATANAGDKPANTEPKSCAVNHRNEQYDTNKDGKLDEQERAAMKADRAAKRQARLLAKYDANKNGQLDPAEEAAHKADLEKRRAARAEKKKAKAAEKAAQAAAAAAEEEDDDEAETKKP